MIAKQQALEVIERSAESITWAEIEEHVRFVATIEIGLDDVQAGRVMPHEAVVRDLQQWPTE